MIYVSNKPMLKMKWAIDNERNLILTRNSFYYFFFNVPDFLSLVEEKQKTNVQTKETRKKERYVLQVDRWMSYL